MYQGALDSGFVNVLVHLMVIFPNLCEWRRRLCSNSGGIDPEKSHRATLIQALSVAPSVSLLTGFDCRSNSLSYLKEHRYVTFQLFSAIGVLLPPYQSLVCLFKRPLPIFTIAFLSSRSRQQYKIGFIEEFIKTTVVDKSHLVFHSLYTVPYKVIKTTFGK